jgi:hypothetical protein
LRIGSILSHRFCTTAAMAAHPRHHDILEEAEPKHTLAMVKETEWVLGGPNGVPVRLWMKRPSPQSRLHELEISRPGM